MDSISRQHPRATSRPRASRVVLLETAKDETDTEAALRLAVDRGADEITVFGALGGPRLDHLVGNLLLALVALAGRTSPCAWSTTSHEVFLVEGDVIFAGGEGDIVSLLPLTPAVARRAHRRDCSIPSPGEPCCSRPLAG